MFFFLHKLKTNKRIKLDWQTTVMSYVSFWLQCCTKVFRSAVCSILSTVVCPLLSIPSAQQIYFIVYLVCLLTGLWVNVLETQLGRPVVRTTRFNLVVNLVEPFPCQWKQVTKLNFVHLSPHSLLLSFTFIVKQDTIDNTNPCYVV